MSETIGFLIMCDNEMDVGPHCVQIKKDTAFIQAPSIRYKLFYDDTRRALILTETRTDNNYNDRFNKMNADIRVEVQGRYDDLKAIKSEIQDEIKRKIADVVRGDDEDEEDNFQLNLLIRQARIHSEILKKITDPEYRTAVHSWVITTTTTHTISPGVEYIMGRLQVSWHPVKPNANQCFNHNRKTTEENTDQIKMPHTARDIALIRTLLSK